MMMMMIITFNYSLFIYLLIEQLKGQLRSKQKKEIQDTGKQRQNMATFII
jgi:hypothetical protein